VYVRYDLRELHSLQGFAGVIIIMLAASCMVYFSSRLRRYQPDSVPGDDKMISAEKNYSLRAEKHGQDEIGTLIDGFNDMLSQIQEKDNRLAEYSEQLEDQVARRTAELKSANEELLAQISEKRKIEDEP
jgi:methyl-accepting chemotaxis protein